MFLVVSMFHALISTFPTSFCGELMLILVLVSSVAHNILSTIEIHLIGRPSLILGPFLRFTSRFSPSAMYNLNFIPVKARLSAFRERDVILCIVT